TEVIDACHEKVDYWKPHEILNVWSANIFPPNYSFRNVCSCDECSTMIDELNDFAESTRSLECNARALHKFRILLKEESEEFDLHLKKISYETNKLKSEKADEKDPSCVAECIRFDIGSRRSSIISLLEFGM
ncbi:linker for activation of T-cells family member 2, partial [Striga asiatica]